MLRGKDFWIRGHLLAEEGGFETSMEYNSVDVSPLGEGKLYSLKLCDKLEMGGQ